MRSSSARKSPTALSQVCYGCSLDHSVVKHQRNGLADTAEGSWDDIGLFHHHKWPLSPRLRSSDCSRSILIIKVLPSFVAHLL